MRSYEEQEAAAYRKAEKLIAEQNRRKKIIFRAAVSSVVCAAACVGIWFISADDAKKALVSHIPENVISEEKNPSVTTVSVSEGSSTDTTASTVKTLNTSSANTTVTTYSSSESKTSGSQTDSKQTENVIINAVTQTESKVSDADTVTKQTYAASVTITSVSVTDISVTTGISDKMPVERSFSMNKISPFLAALIAANPLTAIPSAPADNNISEKLPTPFVYSFYYDEGNYFDCITELHNKESGLDFNKDGKIDINDMYAFYCFYHGVQFKEPEKFDFSAVEPEDDEVHYSSYNFDQMAKYYAAYHPITVDDLDPEPFKEFYFGNASQEHIENYRAYNDRLCENFNEALTASAAEIFLFYNMFKDITVNNNVDLDVSGDGVFDFDDIYYFSAFDYSFRDIALNSDKIDYYLYDPQIDAGLSPDIIERCISLMKTYKYEDLYPMGNSIHRYMLQYYLEDHPYDPAWNDEAYYEAMYPQLEEEYCHSSDLMRDVEVLQSNLGYGSQAMRYYYPDRTDGAIEKEYDSFIKQVESGKRTIPDINGDGELDMADYCLSNLFFETYRYVKDIPFPETYRQTFLTDMDLNDNGMSADVNDVAVYQICIGDELGYSDLELKNAERQYYAEHPEFDPENAGKFTSYYYEFDYENGFDNYVAQIKDGTNKKPDIDKDGKITIADYVYADIIQSAKSTGDEYRTSIVPKEIREYYLNDCDFDKDGYSATYGDLMLITRYVGAKLGLDYEADYNQFYNELNLLEEEFISQFDDQLLEAEKTIKAGFNPEFADNFTFRQLETIKYASEENDYISDHEYEIKENITEEQKKILDTNLNGEIENEDFVIAKAMYENYFKDSDYYTNLLTQERKDNFYSNFDLNGNGINGDYADIRWAELLYQKILNESSPKVAYGQQKQDEINAKRDEWRELPYEEKEIKRHEFMEQYRKDVESGKKPAPDLNEDGKVDIADYVAATPIVHSKIIFQYRYDLITKAHIVTKDQTYRFFKLYDLNDDGIYGDQEDLYIMKMYIQDELGYSNLEMAVYENEYLKQYKDVVDYYFDMSQFDEELTKDMSIFEKYSIIYSGEDYFWNNDIVKEMDYDTIKMFDLNMNGILEPQDYAIAEYLNMNYYTDITSHPEDKALITDAIKENFYKNFDPDHNGICGSYGDIELMEKYLKYVTDDDGFISDYRYGISTETGVALDKIRETLANGGSVVGTEENAERSGDANIDEKLNLADSVAILQAYINPDKYSLSDEGKYNADICNTGDGVTPMDAQKIQKMLLNIK